MSSSSSTRVLLYLSRRRRTRRVPLLLQPNNNKCNNKILRRHHHLAAAQQQQQQRCCFSTSSSSSSVTSAEVVVNLPHKINNDVEQKEEEMQKPLSTSSSPSLLSSYSELAKAKLSTLVVTTTLAGFISFGGNPFSIVTLPVLGSCIVGTALCSSSAAGWNQIIEVDYDKQMKRTQQRPLVQNHISIYHAKCITTTWGVAGVTLLSYGTDPITTILGATNILLYSGLYTYMKPKSIYNTWIGAIVGAIPPIMGYTAAAAASAAGGSGSVDMDILCNPNVFYLGSILYCWQMPHFFALSFMHRLDYKRGGFQMIPVIEYDEIQQLSNGIGGDGTNNATPEAYQRTSNIIIRYIKYLSTIPIVAVLTDQTNIMFGIEGILLNGYFYHVANNFAKQRNNANARKVFLTSLWYLPCILTLYLLHSKVWDENKQEEENTAEKYNNNNNNILSEYIHTIRDAGKQLCIHEKACEAATVATESSSNNNSSSSSNSNNSNTIDPSKEESSTTPCPIVLGKQSAKELDENTTAVVHQVLTRASSKEVVELAK